ncbi:hypothetical protein [Caulobacter segnis]|jgi:hypothetical protein|uniref:Uncharacterized protein n=1 Tax=Caulobacter segnis TaxID=88688 RepID=A0A2W5V2R1_9CAUL|nr:hypothetical protein [Caulobacter segnis]MBR2692201.1 hypothetical protein [Aquamicrobium sp.]PZR30996.1 MAG: hypothetical protein DI526_20970 [Caulobacter segnis]HXG71402.1 hypothetical protein [Gemmatimonadaceae bacterium]
MSKSLSRRIGPINYWPAVDADFQLPWPLVHLIDRSLAAPLMPGITKEARHYMLQTRLHALGVGLGYQSQIEVCTGHRRFIAQGRFDVVWTHDPAKNDGFLEKPIIFEIDSRWKHESALKLGRVGEEALKLWVYYGNRPAPPEPAEPGFRRLNILRIQPWRLGVKEARSVRLSTPGAWPDPLYPQMASSARRP